MKKSYKREGRKYPAADAWQTWSIKYVDTPLNSDTSTSSCYCRNSASAIELRQRKPCMGSRPVTFEPYLKFNSFGVRSKHMLQLSWSDGFWHSAFHNNSLLRCPGSCEAATKFLFLWRTECLLAVKDFKIEKREVNIHKKEGRSSS